jgi:hypothetical protein
MMARSARLVLAAPTLLASPALAYQHYEIYLFGNRASA